MVHRLGLGAVQLQQAPRLVAAARVAQDEGGKVVVQGRPGSVWAGRLRSSRGGGGIRRKLELRGLQKSSSARVRVLVDVRRAECGQPPAAVSGTWLILEGPAAVREGVHRGDGPAGIAKLGVLPQEELCGRCRCLRPPPPLPQLRGLLAPSFVDGRGAGEEEDDRGAGPRNHAQQLFVEAQHVVPAPGLRQPDAVSKLREDLRVALQRQPCRVEYFAIIFVTCTI